MCSHKGSNSLEQKTTQSTLNYLIEDKIMVPTQLLLKKVSKMDKLHCSQEKKKKCNLKVRFHIAHGMRMHSMHIKMSAQT